MARFLGRFRFPIAVALTSLALVAALVGLGGLLVPNVLANGSWFGGWGGGWGGPPWAHGAGGFTLPPELAGLASVPEAERFGHFKGVQVNLTDKDNQPLAIQVTPGVVTAADATSLTIAANDGSSKTFTLNDQTMIHAKGARDGDQTAKPTLAKDDKVVVVTINNSAVATAVMVIDPNGFGPHGYGGRFGWGR